MAAHFRFSLLLILMSIWTSLNAEPVRIQTTPAGNTYASGSELHVLRMVEGDLLAAAGRIRLEREVRSDAALAGGSIEVRAPVGHDLRAAGGSISVSSPIGGEMVAAGGNVEIEESAKIAGPAWIAGGNVSLRGTVGHGARIYARSVVLGGQIDGDVHIMSSDISFDPGARITGDLRYASPAALDQDLRGVVGGRIIYEPFEEDQAVTEPARRNGWLGPLLAMLVAVLLALLLVGLVTYRLFPTAADSAQEALTDTPGRCLLLGTALLFSVPPVAMLTFVTVIGIPLALILIALYPVMLLAGYLGTAFFIAARLSRAVIGIRRSTWWQQAAFLALAFILLALLTWIPFLGFLVLFVAVVAGIGAWVMSIYRRFWGKPPAGSAFSFEPATPA